MEGLSAICGGLGILEEDENGNRVGYSKGEYCLDNLKDLLRFLRRDDPEKREVFKQVCKWNIAAKDLIPIIQYCQHDRNLVLNAVKVLVFLTMPIEPRSIDIPQQIEYLWGLKYAITFSDAMPVIVSLLETPLENLENESLTEDDWKLIQLVLSLFRNILAIQDISIQQKAGGSATQFLSLRDRCLELLFQENVMDLILILSQHTGGSYAYLRQDNLLLLETLYYIFKGQEPELIVKENLKDSKVSKTDKVSGTSLTNLQYIMEEEHEKQKLRRLGNLSSYSQFSGTFTRLAADGSKAPFKGNPCAAPGGALLTMHKDPRGPSKRTMWDHRELPSTRSGILLLLYDFISQFLTGGYNVLMQSIHEDIDKEHQAIQNGDIVMFFQVAQFVSSFQYQKITIMKPGIDADDEQSLAGSDSSLFRGSICGPIAETLNESMFQLVISKWRNAFDGLKETNDYKCLAVAGSLMKVMIRMLDLVLKQSPEDSREPQTARVLLYKLFYDQTEEGMTRFLLNLIRSFDTHKLSRSDLAHVVETVHVVLRLMENLQARGTLRVSRKSRKTRTKRAFNNKNDFGGSFTEEQEGEQLQNHNLDEESNKYTRISSEVEDLSDKNTTTEIQVDEPTGRGPKMTELGNKKSEVDERHVDDRADFSSGDEQLVLTDEVDFKVSSVVSALADNTIIQNLCWLLNLYKSNSISTNHYIICLLQRICDDLELSPMLYQLSLLTIFYNILEEQKSRPRKEYEGIVNFLTGLVRRMLWKMKNYPLLLVEVLFWKTRRECHYINCESMLNELSSLKNEKGKIGSLDSDKDGSFERKRWVRRSIADALGDDDFVVADKSSQEEDHVEADFQIMQERNQSSAEGTESTALISKNEIDGREHFAMEGRSEKICKRRKPLILNDELENKIKDLYEKYKGDENCCHLIAVELDLNGEISEIQVSRALKKLGFKIARKKKTRRFDAPDQFSGERKEQGGDVADSNLTIPEDDLSRSKPLHSRKRVRAFSEDQEQKIRELFEQFKDQKKCSYMIATALDPAGTISAAQVSRKIKQLGLAVPTRRKSDNKLHLRDESSEEVGDSDDETLLSLRRRTKHQRNESLFSERPNEKSVQALLGDASDDELLISGLVKKRKLFLVSMDEESEISQKERRMDEELEIAQNEQEINEIDSTERNGQSSESNEHSQPEEMETVEIHSTKVNHHDHAERGSSKQSAYSEKSKLLQHTHLPDELADFDEEAEVVSPQKNATSRRQLRMIIDEDDE